MSEDGLLTVRDVSAMTSLAPSTLHTWRHRNIGPPSFKLGSRVVYRRTLVQAWLERAEADTARGQS
jgi:predicted DNA-binding transcriptional regulator AlpA